MSTAGANTRARQLLLRSPPPRWSRDTRSSRPLPSTRARPVSRRWATWNWRPRSCAPTSAGEPRLVRRAPRHVVGAAPHQGRLRPLPAVRGPDAARGEQPLGRRRAADDADRCWHRRVARHRKFGYAVIRGPILVFIGWANDDFTRNMRRFVAEERISLATTRPAAVNVVTGLPSA